MLRLALLLAAALTCFAANSILCRLALHDRAIDPLSFTAIRLSSGAVVMAALVARRGGLARIKTLGSARAALVLIVYAIPFAWAYELLSTGTGALLLFGTVQVTMITAGLVGGERLDRWQVAGFAAALLGLVALVAPGVTAPPVGSAALMVIAGVGWGVYSLLGRGGTDPLASTAAHFVLASPLALVATGVAVLRDVAVVASPSGVALAVASGTVASGLGYAAWHATLPRLSATRASAVQLAVPVLAAIGGVALLAEPLTARLAGAGTVVLGGIGLVVGRRDRPVSPRAARPPG